MLEPQTEMKTHVYYKKYSGHSKGVGICWGCLTLCFLIMNIIVFTEPQWIGDSETSPGVGWMGLYEYCELYNSGQNEICRGQFQDFTTILTPAFRASTFFIGVSILIIFLVIFLFILFFFKAAFKYAYLVCGILQGVSTLFMFLGNVIYPHGWDHIQVKRLCGESATRFYIGECTFRWAYMLSIIAMCCIFMITILALLLAFRTNNRLRDFETKWFYIKAAIRDGRIRTQSQRHTSFASSQRSFKESVLSRRHHIFQFIQLLLLYMPHTVTLFIKSFTYKNDSLFVIILRPNKS
ncbi:hypothetical protein HELRODRAFT_185197 [Helobdella robusta]|uniref:Uncharacterized protein n=1 Tax=Helobdella robusta TaxID=6412 RepID=T1FMH8_HELRO|nr:hypothetical protein HELRODRAFT_185197 [Helobdella robusta]ESN91716.1 hypothetical protein HELRODRAFT_185197 [Helobdella robusta]